MTVRGGGVRIAFAARPLLRRCEEGVTAGGIATDRTSAPTATLRPIFQMEILSMRRGANSNGH
jgi:hypothetical protein